MATLADYHHLEKELLAVGFRQDQSPDAPVCRWTIGAAIVDVMPTDERVLGFGNRWYPEAVRAAESFVLPSGSTIRIITAPLFIATKLEAFWGRGGGDYYASHDLEDIVSVIDGRAALVGEIACTTGALRDFLIMQIASIQENGEFRQALPGHLPRDEAGQGRVPIVLNRMRQISTL